MKRIYLIALLFAVLTGIAVYNYAGYLQNSARAEMASAVFSVKRIPENTLITEDMIVLKKVPKESLNQLSANAIALVRGRITNAAVEADEQILTSRLNEIGADKGGLAYKVPKGKRAMTLEVNEITGVAGYIKKADHIDVIASLMLDQAKKDGSIEKISKTVLLLQNTEVLAVSTANSDAKEVGYTNITLAVTPEEAVTLFYAMTSGKITAVLRPILATDVSSIAPYTP